MKVAGIKIVVLALIIGIIPQLTDCDHEGSAAKCHWTAQASLAIAFPLAALGGMTGFGRSRSARRSLAVIGTILGIMVVLLPVRLIGVCLSDAMACNLVMKPTLILAGLVVTALCIAVFLMSGGSQETV